MSSGGITAEVEQFIQENIPSVEQLEVLLLLFEAPGKKWSASEASQKLHRQPTSVAARLHDLHSRGLLGVREEDPPLYSYAPGARAEVVRSLDRAYKERKDAVIQIIFSPARNSHNNLRAFSDAFKIRRPD